MKLARVEQLNTVIIYSKFGKDRCSSLDSVGSRILPISIHLASGHYNIACTAVQLVITSSPAGLSCVNGVGPCSANIGNFSPLPKPQYYYESIYFKFGMGDYVPGYT